MSVSAEVLVCDVKQSWGYSRQGWEGKNKSRGCPVHSGQTCPTPGKLLGTSDQAADGNTVQPQSNKYILCSSVSVLFLPFYFH